MADQIDDRPFLVNLLINAGDSRPQTGAFPTFSGLLISKRTKNTLWEPSRVPRFAKAASVL
jgi:hypothetical protein